MIHKIKAMYDKGKGYSKKQIARELSISRKTVKKYLKMKEEEIVEYSKDKERQKKLDKYREYIEHLLQKYPKLTAVKIKRKLEAKIKEAAASERTYRNYVNGLKETIAVRQKRYYEPVIDMVAGVQSQVDAGEIRGVMIGGIPTTILCDLDLSWRDIDKRSAYSIKYAIEKTALKVSLKRILNNGNNKDSNGQGIDRSRDQETGGRYP